MQNIAIGIEDEPSPDTLREVGIEPPDTLLGLYQGTPSERHGRTATFCRTRSRCISSRSKTRRGRGRPGCRDRRNLIHEVGHYFGLSEEEIEEIEENYWKAGRVDDESHDEGEDG